MFTDALKLFYKYKCAETQRPSPENRCSGLQWGVGNTCRWPRICHLCPRRSWWDTEDHSLYDHCNSRACQFDRTRAETIRISGNGIGRPSIGIELVFESVWSQTVDYRFKFRVLTVQTQSRTSPVECRKRGLSTYNGTSGVSC